LIETTEIYGAIMSKFLIYQDQYNMSSDCKYIYNKEDIRAQRDGVRMQHDYNFSILRAGVLLGYACIRERYNSQLNHLNLLYMYPALMVSWSLFASDCIVLSVSCICDSSRPRELRSRPTIPGVCSLFSSMAQRIQKAYYCGRDHQVRYLP